MTVTNGVAKTYTYDLKQLLPSLPGTQAWGDLTYELKSNSLGSNYYTEGAIIKNGILTLPIQPVQSEEEKEIGSITITIKSTNFADFEATLTVSSSNKIVPTGTVSVQGTITYGQSLNELSLSATMADDSQTPVEGTVSWVNGDQKPSAGTYPAEWTFTPSDPSFAVVTGVTEIQVAKKSIEVTLGMSGTTSKVYDGTTALPA